MTFLVIWLQGEVHERTVYRGQFAQSVFNLRKLSLRKKSSITTQHLKFFILSFIMRYQRQVADVLTSSNIQVPQHHSPLELLLHLILYVPKLIAREWRNQPGTLESVTGGDDTASFLVKLRSAIPPSSFRSCWSSSLTRKEQHFEILTPNPKAHHTLSGSPCWQLVKGT